MREIPGSLGAEGGGALAHASAGVGALPPRGVGQVPLPVPTRRRSLGTLLGALFVGAEWFCGVAAIVLLSGALVPMLLSETVSSSELNQGHPLLRALFAGVYAIALFFLIFRWKTFLAVVLRDKAIVMLLLLATASAAWSISPDVTLRRSVALVLTTVFAWYLVARYDQLRMLRLLGVSLGVVLVLSLFAVVAFPAYGIASGVHDGAWQGVFVHKNQLGKAAALAALVYLLLWRADRRGRVLWGGGLLLALGLVLLSRSLTSMIVLAAMLAIFPFVDVLRWRFSRAAPVLTALLFLGGGALLILGTNVEEALGVVGRDTTLTGRTTLWLSLVHVGMSRPALGAGYGAFWGSEYVDLVQDLAGWNALGGHNGFFDLWLDLGFVGLVVFGLALVPALLRAFRSLRISDRPEAVWPALGIIFVLLASLTESGLLRQNNLIWVTFVMASASALRAVPKSSVSVGDAS